MTRDLFAPSPGVLPALLGLFMLTVSATASADTEAPRPGTVKIYWENDGAFHDPFDSYDRHYTNGFAVVLEHQPDWAQDFFGYSPFSDAFEQRHGGVKTGAGYVLGQLIHTPANLTATASVQGDQPYAGYLYGGAFWQREAQYRHRDDIAVLDHFELNVGVIGEDSLAEDIQDYVHENFTGDDPLGWDNQVGNEVAAQFFYRRKWRMDLGSTESAWLGDLDMQLIPQVGFALGTVYRNAEMAATFRVGFQLPDDFGPGRINDLQSVTGDPFKHTGWSWYAFGRVGGRVVQHDTFLDGSDFESSPVTVESEPVVGELQGGLALGYRYDANSVFNLTWGVTFSTDTFEGATGTQSYGTFVLSWTKAF